MNFAGNTSNALGANLANIFINLDHFTTALQFLETEGLARTLAEPRLVVGSLVREVWPDKSVADLVVTREAQRAGSLMTNLFTSAQTGAIDMPSVERGVGPVLGAIQEGGLSRWLDEVWAHDDVTFQHCLLVSGVVAAFAQKLRRARGGLPSITLSKVVPVTWRAELPLCLM